MTTFKNELTSEKNDPTKPIFIIGATNYIDRIDPVILSCFTYKIEFKTLEKEPRKDFMKFLVKDLSKNPISNDALNYLTQNINDSCINMCRNKQNQIEVQDLKEGCLSVLGFMPQ